MRYHKKCDGIIIIINNNNNNNNHNNNNNNNNSLFQVDNIFGRIPIYNTFHIHGDKQHNKQTIQIQIKT